MGVFILYALINYDELTSRDWKEVLRTLHFIVAFKHEDFLRPGLIDMVDHDLTMRKAAKVKGWIVPPEQILVTLDVEFIDRGDELPVQMTQRCSFNPFDETKPIMTPSLFNENMRVAAIDRAKRYLATVDGPVMTVIEKLARRTREIRV